MSAVSAAPTANDRFKESSRGSFWIGLIIATLGHAAVFMGSPVVALEPVEDAADVPRLITIPPELSMPEPPPPIRRPARPVAADVPVDPLATIDPTIPRDWSRTLEPPAADRRNASRARGVTPMDVAPRLLNGDEVQRALRDHYPPVLRDARIGGVATVWFHIDETGRVVETRLEASSGYEALDRAALRVADRMRFAPALNRDRRVPVWVVMEILFEAR